jgi:hypothetical protein
MAENYNSNEMAALAWDSVISEESSGFTLLPPGEYDFNVLSMSRGFHNGSEKLPKCPKAELEVEISGTEGKTKLKHNLFLHQKTEGLLSAFFISIGLKKHGEPLAMNWNAVPGSSGRCKVSIRKSKNDKGEEREYNQIDRFLEPAEDVPFTFNEPSKQQSFVPGQF